MVFWQVVVNEVFYLFCFYVFFGVNDIYKDDELVFVRLDGVIVGYWLDGDFSGVLLEMLLVMLLGF